MPLQCGIGPAYALLVSCKGLRSAVVTTSTVVTTSAVVTTSTVVTNSISCFKVKWHGTVPTEFVCGGLPFKSII
jgi:hypothetical protein